MARSFATPQWCVVCFVLFLCWYRIRHHTSSTHANSPHVRNIARRTSAPTQTTGPRCRRWSGLALAGGRPWSGCTRALTCTGRLSFSFVGATRTSYSGTHHCAHGSTFHRLDARSSARLVEGACDGERWDQWCCGHALCPRQRSTSTWAALR